MGKYIITAGQNLYDVALHIYGSVEGITDLLVNNPALSLDEGLRTGQELIYTDDYLINANIVAYYRQRAITPANGERHIYFKESQYPRIAEFRLPATATSAGISFSGIGAMEIDWGDNTPLQDITLTRETVSLAHFFDNTISGERVIRLYGDFRFRQVDFTALTPSSVFFLSPVYAEEVTLRSCRAPLNFLPMIQGMYYLDLAKSKTDDLRPVVECRELMNLNLSGVDMLRETLDAFLISLVREHYGRRSCEVVLTEAPSGEYREPQRDDSLNYIINTGMDAIWLLTHEQSWNEGGSWTFCIGDRRYEYTTTAETHGNHSGGTIG